MEVKLDSRGGIWDAVVVAQCRGTGGLCEVEGACRPCLSGVEVA